jgi:hypothetical protein
MTVIERYISVPLEVTMDENGDVWIDATYPEGTQPLMRIDIEQVSGIEAFEIMKQLIRDHEMLNWADARWRTTPTVMKTNTAREAIAAAMTEEAIG